MIYKAVDYWNSPHLEHHGVKGMRWGVRKAIERTGRVVRRAGGAVKKSATTIAGGLYRAGSAVRRFKNRRAIKSANSARIQRRISRMNNEELQAAVTRMDLVNKLRGGNSSSGKTLSDKVSDAIEGKIAKMSSEALETSVNSLLVGESPITGVRRKAKESIASSKASIAENRKKYMITKSSSSSSSDSSSSSSVLTPKVRTTPVSDLNKYVGGPYINRHALYHDDFLAHYGVKGMKWGVRKHEYESEWRHGNKGLVRNLKSGSTVYRIASRRNGSGGNVLYGSTTSEDNDKWAKELYLKKYSQNYIVNKDIKIADRETTSKIYEKAILKNPSTRKLAREALINTDNIVVAGGTKGKNYSEQVKNTINYAHNYFEKHPDSSFCEYIVTKNNKVLYDKQALNYTLNHSKDSFSFGGVYLDKPLTDVKAASSLYAINPDSKAAKIMTNAVKKAGYTAITDVRGYDIATNPIIFLDKKQLELESSTRIVRDSDSDKYKGLTYLQKTLPSKARKERDDLIEQGKYRVDYVYHR